MGSEMLNQMQNQMNVPSCERCVNTGQVSTTRMYMAWKKNMIKYALNATVVQVSHNEKAGKNSRGLKALLNKCLFSKKRLFFIFYFVNKQANELSHLKLLNSSAF